MPEGFPQLGRESSRGRDKRGRRGGADGPAQDWTVESTGVEERKGLLQYTLMNGNIEDFREERINEHLTKQKCPNYANLSISLYLAQTITVSTAHNPHMDKESTDILMNKP